MMTWLAIAGIGASLAVMAVGSYFYVSGLVGARPVLHGLVGIGVLVCGGLGLWQSMSSLVAS